MTTRLIRQQVGPCSPYRQIKAWIDELLDMRLQMRGQDEAVREIDYQIQTAVDWLDARDAGVKCA
ncbi:MAG: hypothetical protein ABFS14_05885 [Gemmatimonadota bacterium]